MYDLVVIGAGSGGVSVASAAARVGATTALIEKQPSGTEGRTDACIPSKALVQAAKRLREIQRADHFGIQAGTARIDFPALMQSIRSTVAAVGASRSDESLRALGVDVFHGEAAFSAYDTVLLNGSKRIEGHRFVIATGSRPAPPSVPGLVDTGFLDTSTVWSLANLPESLIILGAGPVGLEFAQAFARLGTKVTVITDQQSVLPNVDSEVAGSVACHLTGEGITFHRGVTVQKVEKRGDQKVCILHGPESTGRIEATAADVLHVGGRLANVEGLNLEEVGVHADPEHGIEVDALLQTDAMRIFAIGDVLLRNQYTHVAEREAEIAFQNAVLRRRKKIDYSQLPSVTFVDPEVASVGISEADAKSQGLEHHVFQVPYDQIDRAQIDGRTEGFAKVVTSPSGEILGATIFGEEASLVLQQLVVAMDRGIALGDLTSTAQIYPTYARIIHHLAEQQRTSRRQRGFFRTALKLFYGFQPRSVVTDEASSEASSNGAQAESHATTTTHGHH